MLYWTQYEILERLPPRIINTTVTVYVWLPQETQAGHASMTLGNGRHISLWPAEEKYGVKGKKMKKAKYDQKDLKSHSVDEDIELEGREFDASFEFDFLDENAIQEWWDEFDIKWSIIKQNCCKTVIDGLRAGGTEKSLSLKDKLYGMLHNGRPWFPAELFLWTPNQVIVYCSKMLNCCRGGLLTTAAWTFWPAKTVQYAKNSKNPNFLARQQAISGTVILRRNQTHD